MLSVVGLAMELVSHSTYHDHMYTLQVPIKLNLHFPSSRWLIDLILENAVSSRIIYLNSPRGNVDAPMVSACPLS